LSSRATVTDRGAVLLGKNVACDAFEESRLLRVVTHAHADHTGGLRQSLRICKRVLMTRATKDMIDVMQSPLFLLGGAVETLEYGQTIQHDGENITLFKADHILGAAQVLVEDCDGKRIVFTGDFRIDETPIVESNILVIEATYGSPACKRSFRTDIKTSLISLVEKGLKKGTVYIFGYHGKLQEVMQILHDADLNVPFVAPERVFQVSKVCERHGMRIGRLMLSGEPEAAKLLDTNTPCLAFYHMGSQGTVGLNGFRVVVSGWEFDSAIRQTGTQEYVVALSDHSDFNGLMEYVKRSKPEQVITDNSRVSNAETLAKEIRKSFGIPAIAMPKRDFS
jgi:putative mRNA 3-end processing factor